MLEFVNAKINIGLFVTERRADGYHNLSTIFYPIGLYSGLPDSPDSFGDILEINLSDKTDFKQSGHRLDCPKEKNLVWRAVQAYSEAIQRYGKSAKDVQISLYKSLPDGAGMGGGSADASFTLKILNKLNGDILDDTELISIARSIGADCPFFLLNKPVYAEGIGDVFTPISLNLNGHYLLIIKPEESMSTREAFSMVKPHQPDINLIEMIQMPIGEWHKYIKNDFENSFFHLHPHLVKLKDELYKTGALYASMSGSGSAFYGIYPSEGDARNALQNIECKYKRVVKL
jgi:4-diphosphocytidyl-2-C-methyl-D-erythritol kinase